MASISLRDYQSRAIKMLYAWFENNQTGHIALCMPGGSGKSIIIAQIVKDSLQWPDTKTLMLVHSKKLVQQNANELLGLCPDVDLGVVSAGLKRKEFGHTVTFAGIGSIYRHADKVGSISLLIVDEVHAISNEEAGIYRKMIADLLEINPDMRIIGLSASPYRTTQGKITEGDKALFTEILEPVTIQELVDKGYLAPLRSKRTEHVLDTSKLHRRMGEFIASEMDAEFNTDANNHKVVAEVIARAEGCRHIIVFCSTIKHSNRIAELFREYGETAVSLTSKASNGDAALASFESGECRILCNVSMMSVGYNFRPIDCVVFLRATSSPGWYLQAAVRGMRLKEHTGHCLVLDFCGNIDRHGPVTEIVPPRRKGDGSGDPPLKVCPECQEILHISIMKCPCCGYVFPPTQKVYKLSDQDIMGVKSNGEMDVTSWTWRKQISRTSGKPMLSCTYYGGLSDKPVTEYLTVGYMGYSGEKAMRTLYNLAQASGALLTGAESMSQDEGLTFLADQMNKARPPSLITFKLDGKFYQILTRSWSRATQETAVFSRSTEVLSHM